MDLEAQSGLLGKRKWFDKGVMTGSEVRTSLAQVGVEACENVFRVRV
jgi:hypothetical protein